MKIITYVFRWMLWNVFSRLFVIGYLLPRYRFRLVPGSDRFPKPPFIVVANHGTFFDPWMIGRYSLTPFAFMVNDDGFRGKGVSQWYLRKIGTIPKKKGAADFKAMRLTMEMLAKGYPVCIFPEGQTTWDGETQLIYKGIEKVIKRAGCPLVIARLKGNFLTKPWWAETLRKGRILIEVRTIGVKELGDMSTDRLFATIKSEIRQNDIKDAENAMIRFTGTNLAEGLERFVWICPGCGTEDTLVCSGNEIRCTACGERLVIDAHCRLSKNIDGISDLKDWAEWHRKKVLDKIQTCNENDILTSGSGIVMMEERPDHTFSPVEPGTLTLTESELVFANENGSRTFPVDGTEDCVIQKKDIFEIRYGKEYFRFLFEKHSPMKWVYYLRYLKGYEQAEGRGFL